MKFPIFVYEHGDVNVYNSINEVQSDLEAIDVHNQEYEVYDALGSRLKLDTKVEEKKVLGGVLGKTKNEYVVLDEHFYEQGHQDELYKKLSEFIKQVDKSFDLNNTSLDDVVEYMKKITG